MILKDVRNSEQPVNGPAIKVGDYLVSMPQNIFQPEESGELRCYLVVGAYAEIAYAAEISRVVGLESIAVVKIIMDIAIADIPA